MPSTPMQTAKLCGKNASVVGALWAAFIGLREPVECSPCQLKVCPIDHRCMTRLLPARVLAEARAALSRSDWLGSVELELGR